MRDFGSRIVNWYNLNKRDLPWRDISDPYKVWVSEIILQQTQVKQGTPYYLKFIDRFPTVIDLAASNEQDVLNIWQGLGYYSRARNMHKAAQKVVVEMDGIFPFSYDDLIKLNGIGDYTASAISSIISGEKHAVLDGNVYRVLARHRNIHTPINSSAGTKEFKSLATSFLHTDKPGDYNQGLMELGALVCTPTSPACNQCPISDDCLSANSDKVAVLPVKIKSKKRKSRYFTYLFIENTEGLVLKKRGEHDIWANLYEPLLKESDSEMSIQEVQESFETYKTHITTSSPMVIEKHILSHQTIYAKAFLIKSHSEIEGIIPWNRLEEFPLPRLVEKLLEKLKE